VVRVHLQFGRFMDAPNTPNRATFERFDRLLKLAEHTGLYLDVTGLACYRTATFHRGVTRSMNRGAGGDCAGKLLAHSGRAWRCESGHLLLRLDEEPIVPGEKRKPGDWYSGNLLANMISFNLSYSIRPDEKREDIAAAWIETMTRAIREGDSSHLITVGMLPWVQGWGHHFRVCACARRTDAGFPQRSHLSATKNPGEAREALRQCRWEKPS